jgi:hypothetical protein
MARPDPGPLTVYVVGQPAAYGSAVEQSKVDVERASTLLVF